MRVNKKLFVLGIMCVVVFSGTLLAGREAEYSNKYPYLMFIGKNVRDVWFAGAWYDELIVIQRDSSQKWHTFTEEIGGEYNWGTLKINQQESRIVFSGYDVNQYFDMWTKQWLPNGTNVTYTSESANKQSQPFVVDKASIKIGEGDNQSVYEFPLPSFNAYKRWRSPPRPDYDLNDRIGQYLQIGTSIWFAVDFYAGEGSTGIGGIGVFDLQSKRFGIFRNPLLSDCSAAILAHRGDTLFIATGVNSEYGLYGCNGLILMNTKTGAVAQIGGNGSPLDGSYFTGMEFIDDCLWMLTERAIVGWNLTTNVWTSARLESFVVKDSSSIYTRSFEYDSTYPGSYNTELYQYAGTLLPREIVKYEWAEIKWKSESKFSQMAEITTSTTDYGWVKREPYSSSQQVDKDQIAQGSCFIIYEDSLLTRPFHQLRFSPLRKIGESQDAVSVSFSGYWIELGDVEPNYSLQSVVTNFPPAWVSANTNSLPLKERMYATLREEQDEIRNKVPVYDTLLTINKT